MKSIYLKPILKKLEKEYSIHFGEDVASTLISNIEKIIHNVETVSRNHAIYTLEATLNARSYQCKLDSAAAVKTLIHSYTKRYKNTLFGN